MQKNWPVTSIVCYCLSMNNAYKGTLVHLFCLEFLNELLCKCSQFHTSADKDPKAFHSAYTACILVHVSNNCAINVKSTQIKTLDGMIAL